MKFYIDFQYKIKMEEIKEMRTMLNSLQVQLDKLEAKLGVKPELKLEVKPEPKYILDKDVKKVKIFKDGHKLKIVNNVLIVGDETKELFVEKDINCEPTNADIRGCLLYIFTNNNKLYAEFSNISPENIININLYNNKMLHLWAKNI